MFSIKQEVQKLIEEYQIQCEKLTREQLVEAIRQAVECGDFARYVRESGKSQTVVYIPYREFEMISGRYNELLNALKRPMQDESRHEAVLRAIRNQNESDERTPFGSFP